MFGLLRPRKKQLHDSARTAFQETYCGLCTELNSEHGRLSSMLLSYDLTFLLGLYSAVEEAPVAPLERHLPEVPSQRRCSVFPLRSVMVAGQPELRRLLSHLTLALVQAKLEDDALDDGSLTARAILRTARERFRRAGSALEAEGYPLELLRGLPQEQAAREAQLETAGPGAALRALERCAEPTSRLLERTFDWLSELRGHPAPLRRNLGRFGGALGCAIYYADSAKDDAADARKGRFNPLHLATTGPEQRRIREGFARVREELASSWLAVRSSASTPADERTLWPALEASLATLAEALELPVPEISGVRSPQLAQSGLLFGVRRREPQAAYWKNRLIGESIIEVLDYCCWLANSRRAEKRREQELAEEEAAAAFRPPSIVGESAAAVRPTDEPLDPMLIPTFEQGPWACPGCQAPQMERHPMGRGGLFSCATCRGIWLDPRHLGEVKKGMEGDSELAFARGAAPPSQKQGERLCPEDGETLDVVRRNGVTIDECPLCGSWFLDPGELAGFVR